MKTGRILWYNERTQLWEGDSIKQVDDDLWKFPLKLRIQNPKYITMYVSEEKDVKSNS